MPSSSVVPMNSQLSVRLQSTTSWGANVTLIAASSPAGTVPDAGSMT